MTWTELLQLAGGERELRVLDLCVCALSDSGDERLHAEVAAAVPTLAELCALLDQHGVPVPRGAEPEIVIQPQFVHA
ncbi:MAG: hypothetical protein KIT60_10990 [Burkholderiaceae bacterium]|nr:hypothetical protein [Burkholderiaceae bacterium]